MLLFTQNILQYIKGEINMKSTGIVREIDKVGRIVIPKEIRSNLQINDNDPMEIFIDNDCIVIRKYEPSCIFCKSVKEVITYHDRKICRECLEMLKNVDMPINSFDKIKK